MNALQEDSSTSLADKVRKRKLPWSVTEWHINRAEDKGDVDYLENIYRQQEEEQLPFIADTTPSPGGQTQPATAPSERTESASDGPGSEAGSNQSG